MSNLLKDLQYALRTLRRSPGFTLVTVLTLALGVGANTAIFSLVNAVLLRPLPFPDPGRLVLVWEEASFFGLKDSPPAIGNYRDWRAENHTFGEMGGLERRSYRLLGQGAPEILNASTVTAGVLRSLGVQPLLGRWFREDEDQPGTAKVAILSHALWQRLFAGDPGVLGRTVRLNDFPYTIVGVMPRGFRFPDSDNDLWTPSGTEFSLRDLNDRDRRDLMVVGRLKPGVTLAQADSDMKLIAERLKREFPKYNAHSDVFVQPLRQHFLGSSRRLYGILLGTVGFVLLIACCNVANLLLSRAAGRRREMAVRTALGGGGAGIVRLLLAESMLITGLGGALGIGLAALTLSYLEKLMPSGIAAMTALSLDWRVLAYTLVIAVLTAAFFGLLPAWQTRRLDIGHALKQGGPRTAGNSGAGRLRRVLAVSGVAAAFVLAVGAGLLIQTFAKVRGVDPGCRVDHVLTMKTPFSGWMDTARKKAYYRQVLDRIHALPGVRSAGYSLGIPIAFKGWFNGYLAEGHPADEKTTANFRVVTPGFMPTLAYSLKAGRFFNERDDEKAPRVAVVNETLARAAWPGQNAIGKHLIFPYDKLRAEVVGVVADVKQAGLDVPPKPEMYFSYLQDSASPEALAIHTSVDPLQLVGPVRQIIWSLDKEQPITEVASMEQILDREVFDRRLQAALLACFAGLALVLAALGIYGVLACLVAQRVPEIGIRMALGADPGAVLRAITGQGLRLAGAGLVVGAGVAWGLVRVLEKLLFGLKATDPATFAGVALLLLATAALASYLPARRAMQVDPLIALREE